MSNKDWPWEISHLTIVPTEEKPTSSRYDWKPTRDRTIILWGEGSKWSWLCIGVEGRLIHKSKHKYGSMPDAAYAAEDWWDFVCVASRITEKLWLSDPIIFAAKRVKTNIDKVLNRAATLEYYCDSPTECKADPDMTYPADRLWFRGGINRFLCSHCAFEYTSTSRLRTLQAVLEHMYSDE